MRDVLISMKKIIEGKTIKQWLSDKPLLGDIIKTKEVFWINPKYQTFEEAIKKIELKEEDVIDASLRLKRFSPYIKSVFPETSENDGLIESPLKRIPKMNLELEKQYNFSLNGNLLLKCDNELAISGSIKARGGIYEVLKFAEDLAIKNELISYTSDYSMIDSDKFRNFYSQYSISVGSTGNLGLSIGIMSAKLGFKVCVHMSCEAKKWKKDLLRSIGVKVIEYATDYTEAVKAARKQAEQDSQMYFIDDENSLDLFLGYAVSAYHLKEQLVEMNIIVNHNNPLNVYLPSGVGGGPGGVTFGLKLIFKDHVQCYFAEPTHSPCMLIGLLTGLHNKICVQDFEIDNKTIADGLAVGRPSGFVGKSLENLISGVYTISDETLKVLLKVMIDTEGIKLEPSALAGVYGIVSLANEKLKVMENTTHLAWATGGGMVPKNIMDDYYISI